MYIHRTFRIYVLFCMICVCSVYVDTGTYAAHIRDPLNMCTIGLHVHIRSI